MSISKRLTWISITVVTGALLSVLVFLYVRTQSFGELDYFENVALLRHLKQLDAQWELDVLKSKIGINMHYDPLADSLSELTALLGKFEAGIGAQKHDDAAALTESRATLLRVIAEKTALIERFKSINSVLYNSQVFLPTAAQEVQESIGHSSESVQSASKRTSVSVNKLLLATMLYSQSASDGRHAEIEAELSHLEPGLKVLPSHIKERLDVFAAHVRTILREQEVINVLLGGIAAVPTAGRIDDINNVLSGEQRRGVGRNQQHRQYLLMFSVLLVGLLVYAAVNLLRSHAMINRVNRQLVGVNETLEQRVQERTHELSKTQTELVATARLAGMAEIATNVLHNVGNVLNSVNISAGLVSTRLRTSKVRGLARAVGLMDARANDLGEFLTRDPKGKLLPAYLRELAPELEAEHAAMAEELGVLGKSVDHIKEVVATQQSHAGASRIVESVKLGELIDDALRMNSGALTRHKVDVLKDVPELPALPLDRHRVLQILVNLISNSENAMNDTIAQNPCIRLGATLLDGRVLRITVADNGEGIAPENLTRVFAHGFTTRKEGHGFGLHSCVIAAQEMGGSLTVHSDGAGQGATFILEIPIDAPEGKR